MKFFEKSIGKSLSKSLRKFLKQVNCDYEENKDLQNNTVVFRFDFQGGHYLATVNAADDGMEVTFPCIIESSLDNLNSIRALCNDFNTRTYAYKFNYFVESEDNKVRVDITFFVNDVPQEGMKNMLVYCFMLQRDFLQAVKQSIEQANDLKTTDIEADKAQFDRELHLIAEQELRHQGPILSTGAVPCDGSVTLWKFLTEILHFGSERLLWMAVNHADGQERLEGHDTLAACNLCGLLIQGHGAEACFMHDYAVIDLHYTDEANGLGNGMVTLALTREAEAKDALYVRVDAMRQSQLPSRRRSARADEVTPGHNTVLLAYDRTDNDQRRAEADYMWKDALLKQSKGKSDELTDDERMLLCVTDADVAYNLYWGQRHVAAKRYFEAIGHLRNVYETWRTRFSEMSEDNRRTFLDVCYLLGFCYNCLQQYEKAFYYLHIVAEDGNLKHAMEYVNTLTNARDIRVFRETDRMMDAIKQNWGNSDDLPEGMAHFVSFLRRRRAYSLIDFHHLDLAENMLKEMLDEPENADFAINELAYLKRLRGAADSGTAPLPDADKA